MPSFPIDLTPTSTLQMRIQPGIIELRNLNVPTLGIINKRGTMAEQVQHNVNLGGATATGELSTANVSTFSADKIAPAYWNLGAHRLRASFEMTAREYGNAVDSARAGVPEPLFNLLNYKSQAAQREIYAKLGALIFNGTGSAADSGIIGLETTISAVTAGKSTVAYAGINPADAGNGRWTSFVFDDALSGATIAKLAAFEADLRSGQTLGSPSNYDAVVVNPQTALMFAELGLEKLAYNTTINQETDVGFFGYRYAGRPVIEDPNVSAGSLHFVNTTDLFLYFWDSQHDPDMYGAERPIDDIPMYLVQLPNTNPELVQFALYCKAQLVLRNRHSLASYINAIAPSEVTP